jgi:hypothetical protein
MFRTKNSKCRMIGNMWLIPKDADEKRLMVGVFRYMNDKRMKPL